MLKKILIANRGEIACRIIKTHKGKLNKLASRLLEKEVIFRDDLISILGNRPFAEKNEPVVTPKKK